MRRHLDLQQGDGPSMIKFSAAHYPFTVVRSAILMTMDHPLLTRNTLMLFSALLLNNGGFLVVEISEVARALSSLLLSNLDSTFPGKHGTHFRGVTAIPSNKNSPSSRQPVKEIIQVADSPLSNSLREGSLMESSRQLM